MTTILRQLAPRTLAATIILTTGAVIATPGWLATAPHPSTAITPINPTQIADRHHVTPTETAGLIAAGHCWLLDQAQPADVWIPTHALVQLDGGPTRYASDPHLVGAAIDDILTTDNPTLDVTAMCR